MKKESKLITIIRKMIKEEIEINDIQYAIITWDVDTHDSINYRSWGSKKDGDYHAWVERNENEDVKSFKNRVSKIYNNRLKQDSRYIKTLKFAKYFKFSEKEEFIDTYKRIAHKIPNV